MSMAFTLLATALGFYTSETRQGVMSLGRRVASEVFCVIGTVGLILLSFPFSHQVMARITLIVWLFYFHFTTSDLYLSESGMALQSMHLMLTIYAGIMGHKETGEKIKAE
jgi:hypothetical protein